jgi:hypothetical protein
MIRQFFLTHADLVAGSPNGVSKSFKILSRARHNCLGKQGSLELKTHNMGLFFGNLAELTNLWSGKRITKKPTLVVGKKPNGKSRLKGTKRMSEITYAVKVTNGKAEIYNAKHGNRVRSVGSNVTSAQIIGSDSVQVTTASGKVEIYDINHGNRIRTI